MSQELQSREKKASGTGVPCRVSFYVMLRYIKSRSVLIRSELIWRENSATRPWSWVLISWVCIHKTRTWSLRVYWRKAGVVLVLGVAIQYSKTFVKHIQLSKNSAGFLVRLISRPQRRGVVSAAAVERRPSSCVIELVGPMDKASVFETEDSRFDPWQARNISVAEKLCRWWIS